MAAVSDGWTSVLGYEESRKSLATQRVANLFPYGGAEGDNSVSLSYQEEAGVLRVRADGGSACLGVIEIKGTSVTMAGVNENVLETSDRITALCQELILQTLLVLTSLDRPVALSQESAPEGLQLILRRAGFSIDPALQFVPVDPKEKKLSFALAKVNVDYLNGSTDWNGVTETQAYKDVCKLLHTEGDVAADETFVDLTMSSIDNEVEDQADEVALVTEESLTQKNWWHRNLSPQAEQFEEDLDRKIKGLGSVINLPRLTMFLPQERQVEIRDKIHLLIEAKMRGEDTANPPVRQSNFCSDLIAKLATLWRDFFTWLFSFFEKEESTIDS